MKYLGITCALLVFLLGCASQPVSTNTKEEDQELAKIYKDMGIAYLRRGEVERAQERLEKSFSIDEADSDVLYLLAEVYSRLGRTADAEAYFRKAMALKPNDPNLLNNFAVFLCSQKKYSESEEIFIRVVNNPTYSTPYLALENAGRCVLRNNENDKAEQYFSNALRMQAKLPNALFYMSELQYIKGEYFKARAFFERYLEVGAESPQMLLLGYQIEMKLGDEQMAAKYADRLVTQYRDSEQTEILRKLTPSGDSELKPKE